MGNRSRHGPRVEASHGDSAGDGGKASDVGSRNDPLYGIPDTNMPHLAGIRLARSLQTWRPVRTTPWGLLALTWLLAVLVLGLLLAAFALLR